jgi:integrase
MQAVAVANCYTFGMRDMGKPNGLFQRGSVWYFRKRWPKRYLKDGECRPDYVKSLRTRLYADALAALPLETLKADNFFKTAHQNKGRSGIVRTVPPVPLRPNELDIAQLKPEEIRPIIWDFFDRAMLALDSQRADGSSLHKDDAYLYSDELTNELLDLTGDNNDAQNWIAEIEASLLVRAKRKCDRDSPVGRILTEYVRRALIQLNHIKRARLFGDYRDALSDELFFERKSTASITAIENGAAFGEAVADYFRTSICEGVGESAHPKKTLNRYKSELDHIEGFFGSDTLLSSLKRRECENFRMVFSQLPPNFAKHMADRKLDYDQLASANMVEGGPTLSAATQKKYLSQLSRFFEWAYMREYVPRNYASDLAPMGAKTQGSMAKLPFEADELHKLFHRPVYTGCEDDRYGFNKPGPNIIKRARYWLPLIALFTGMRSGEILQLTPKHIQRSPNGTVFFSLTMDMQLKTKNAERQIPVHSMLIEMGWLDWVAERDDRAGLLFPEVEPDEFGHSSSKFSKWFGSDLGSGLID